MPVDIGNARTDDAQTKKTPHSHVTGGTHHQRRRLRGHRFLKPGIATTHLRIDPEVAYMSDHEILDLFNESVLAQERAQASYRHVGLEIPERRPQVRYSERFDH